MDSKTGRAILTTALFRFSPQTQPIKQTAIDRLVENAISSQGGSVGVVELQEILGGEGSLLKIAPTDILSSLDRLRKEGILLESQAVDRLVLSAQAKDEIELRRRISTREHEKVVRELFGAVGWDLDTCLSAFLEVLAAIFADLGEESVSLLRGLPRTESAPAINDVEPYCTKTAQRHDLETDSFTKIVSAFFESDEPHFNEIKWRIAQSYFIAACIGVEDSSAVLARDKFQRAIFYLDTNVAIPALEPIAKLHRSFNLIKRTGSQLDVMFRICQITLDELGDWVNYEYQRYHDVESSLPDGTLDSLGSLFGHIRETLRRDGVDATKETVFENFRSPLEDLGRKYGVEREDDLWFEQKRQDSETQKLAAEVRRVSLAIRSRPKHNVQAVHDALLLRWIQHQRWKGYKDAWLLTADTSLPSVSHRDKNGKALVVTMDALLQWLSPRVSVDTDQEAFKTVFADVVRERLLPQQRFFSLQDFAIFSELGISVKEMPADDVVSCVQYIKDNVGVLNLSDAEDRERLHYEIKRFFADPDRKFKQELSRLESENEQIRMGLDSAEKRAEALRDELDEERKARKIDSERHQKALEKIWSSIEERELSGQGWRRFWAVSAVAVLLVVAAIFIALEFGDQDLNRVARILEWWEIYSGIVLATVAAGSFVVGRKRFRAMRGED